MFYNNLLHTSRARQVTMAATERQDTIHQSSVVAMRGRLGHPAVTAAPHTGHCFNTHS